MSKIAGEWNTEEVRPWIPPQTLTSQPLTFPVPYTARPRIALGFNSLDVNNDANIRARVTASNITNTGFTIHGDTWDNTNLYSAGAGWLSMADTLEFRSGQIRFTANGRQQHQSSVVFVTPFVTPPKVISALSELDLPSGAPYRLKTYVTHIDVNGFTIHVDTWGNGSFNVATVNWIAYDGDKENVVSGTFATDDTLENPVHEHSGRIEFAFGRIPSIFLAVSHVDFDDKFNVRFKLFADDISNTGLTWHLDSWNNTILYRATGSYLCFV